MRIMGDKRYIKKKLKEQIQAEGKDETDQRKWKEINEY